MARLPVFLGTAPALVTPFTTDDRVDEAAVRDLLDFVIEGSPDADGYQHAGCEAVVVLGTTGENPTITADERRRLVELAVEHVAGRVPVVVGAGTNDTRTSAQYAREAADAGADGLLVVSPYYNKPTPDGLVGHVAALADATDCPLVFYNVPGRTGQNVTAETQLRLFDAVETVVGTKEASGNLNQIADLVAHAPEGLAVYAGDDDLALPTVALGGAGLISVCANAIPGPTSGLVRRALAGDLAGARRLHYALLAAMRASFVEANPTPVKTALAAMGRMEAAVRLPLAPLTEGADALVRDAYGPWIRAAKVDRTKLPGMVTTA